MKQVMFSRRTAHLKDGAERNKVITKIDIIIFSGIDVWNLGDRLESDLAERTATEERHILSGVGIAKY